MRRGARAEAAFNRRVHKAKGGRARGGNDEEADADRRSRRPVVENRPAGVGLLDRNRDRRITAAAAAAVAWNGPTMHP